MDLYARVENDQVVKFPYSMDDLRMDNRNTSFPVDALLVDVIRSEFGVAVVDSTERPIRKGYKAVPSAQKSGDNWVQSWELVPKTLDEITDDDLVDVRPEEMEVLSDPRVDNVPGFSQALSDPEFVDGQWIRTLSLVPIEDWYEGRLSHYGTADKQIEFITENGLEAWQARVADIKARYPKT